MDLSLQALMSSYWATPKWEVNLLIIFNLVGALVLGCLLGYERWYHGRAAGMRTYGLVCMASAAVISIIGYSSYWYGHAPPYVNSGDMTRVAQGILTGVGFLGAGMIMREGLSISGLTSAASVWVSSVIGILLGVGFYAAAMAVSVLCVLCMLSINKLENILPRRFGLFVTVSFTIEHEWTVETLRSSLHQLGLTMHEDSIKISSNQQGSEWSFMVSAQNRDALLSVIDLSREIMRMDHIVEFSVQPTRN